MKKIQIQSSISVIILVAVLTIILTCLLIFFLNQIGFIAFIGGGFFVNSFNLITDYLGFSILFFVPVAIGYLIFFILLKQSLEIEDLTPKDIENIRFYNGGLEMFITLFFAIGVIFTAWGMQNALVKALGNINKTEAAQLGAWGILQRLVDNGILIALWTTIVGGAGGYCMRIIKYIGLGKSLTRFNLNCQNNEKQHFFSILETIKKDVDQIKTKIV